MMSGEKKENFFSKVELSALISVFWIIVLFSFSVAIVLIAPRHLDPSWTQPTSPYQVQMYEVVDPNFYISSSPFAADQLQHVYHLKDDFSLLGFFENDVFKIVTTPALEKYINRGEGGKIKLTPKLLALRYPTGEFVELAKNYRNELQKQWENKNPNWLQEGSIKPDFEIWEMFAPEGKEAFALAPSDGMIENWADKDYEIIDGKTAHPHFSHNGVIYFNNPREYRIINYTFGKEQGWHYDPQGVPIKSIEELKGHPLGFRSRQELIGLGEHIYAIEGCWYCHTDQTRTLVRDLY